MKKTLLALLFYLSLVSCFGQANGDYRSRVSGYWTTINTWQVFNNGWQTLSSPLAGPFQNILPSSASGAILITHTVTVNSPVLPINQTTISSGAVLSIAKGSTVQIVDDFTVT